MEIESEKVAQMMKIYDGLRRSSDNFNRALPDIKKSEGEVYLLYWDMYKKHVPREVRASINEDLFIRLEQECLELGVNFEPFNYEY